MKVFFDSPRDFENVCVVARTLEVFGIRRCYVYDPFGLIKARYGKSRTRQIKKTSAGAFFKVQFERVDRPQEFLSTLPGRKVATVPDQNAPGLTGFVFDEKDTILFGSEACGIREEILQLCDQRITVPQRGATESLNLAIASGIVLFEFFRQEDSKNKIVQG